VDKNGLTSAPTKVSVKRNIQRPSGKWTNISGSKNEKRKKKVPAAAGHQQSVRKPVKKVDERSLSAKRLNSRPVDSRGNSKGAPSGFEV
jgi:hypothetical protein